MSSGRNKYTTTPTYGMQRRGIGKKQPEKPTNSGLDFTQKPTSAFDTQIPGFPDQFSGPQGIFHDPVPQQGAIPFQQMPVSNQPVVNPATFPMQGMEAPNGFPLQGINMQPSYPPQNAGMQGGYPAQGGNGYSPLGMNAPAGYPMQPMGGQNGFTGYPAGYPDPFNTMNQPMTGTQSAYTRPPLVNTAQAAQENTAGSVRAQGYVPPTVMRADQPVPTMPQQPAFVQQGMPYQDQPLPYNQPMYAQPPQAQPNTPGMGAYPGYQYPNDGGQPPMQPPGSAPKQPVNIDNWLKMLLYIILPIIFVLCIALPSEFDIVRYLFMIASASSVGIMWYRQTFGSSLRTGISIGYGLMCIIVVVMMASGNSDLVNTGANITAQPTPVITDEPSGALGYQADQAPATTSPVEVLPKDTEAGQRLSAFMDNWMDNRVEDMLNYVMPSWRQTKTDAAAELFIIISNRTPLEYSIEAISGTDNDTSRSITMNATIDKNNGNDPVRYRFVILMDYEEGDWYVDPNSLSTNDVDDNADATEVPSDLEAIFTLAPRMTVTPVPPDSTLLYYNANGGTYYHADPECSAVNAKYLPMATFTYGELGNAPYNQLLPCLKCNAPTK